MRKFLKSVVAAILVASMSVTGLATIASAKNVSYSQLPKAYYDWAMVEKYENSGKFYWDALEDMGWGLSGNYGASEAEEFIGIPAQLIRRTITFENMYSRDVVGRDASKIHGVDKLTKGDVVRYAVWSLRKCASEGGWCELYTYADIVWYLMNECGWSREDCEIFKDDAVDYILNCVNPEFESLMNYYRKERSDTNYVTRKYTEEEAEQYWDRIVLVFDESPCIVNKKYAEGLGYKASLRYINMLDMKNNQVYYDMAGRTITKTDVKSGILASGYYCDGSTKNAQKLLSGDTTTSDSKSTTPTLTKSAKVAKTQLNKVLKGLKAGTITMSNAEYKALRKLYQNSGMPSSEIKGKTFNKNLKIAMVQKLRYALPYMSNAQVKSLRTQLAGILA